MGIQSSKIVYHDASEELNDASIGSSYNRKGHVHYDLTTETLHIPFNPNCTCSVDQSHLNSNHTVKVKQEPLHEQTQVPSYNGMIPQGSTAYYATEVSGKQIKQEEEEEEEYEDFEEYEEYEEYEEKKKEIYSSCCSNSNSSNLRPPVLEFYKRSPSPQQCDSSYQQVTSMGLSSSPQPPSSPSSFSSFTTTPTPTPAPAPAPTLNPASIPITIPIPIPALALAPSPALAPTYTSTSTSTKDNGIIDNVTVKKAVKTKIPKSITRSRQSFKITKPAIETAILRYIKRLEIDPIVEYTVYTDGSYLEWEENGQKCGVAGIGIFGGPNNCLNLSESVDMDLRQSSALRAEIHAVIRALEVCQDLKGSLRIELDCHVLIDAMDNSMEALNRTNPDLYRKIKKLMNKRKFPVHFRYVPGHIGIPGNVFADKLAGEATKERREYIATRVPKAPFSLNARSDWYEPPVLQHEMT
ncbi:hypothetical protein F4703DRAFT_1923264 [Phycomyces blakesleeanus]